jgi:hypothetical protein
MATLPDFRKRMVESLISVACEAEGAPFVAQGIVSARFDYLSDDLGAEALPLVEALLGDKCPGAVGIKQATIDRLDELKKQFTTDGAVPRGGE